MLNSTQKLQKRKDIAKSTCALFLEKGYVNITISQIAKAAKIGKGTVYEYFENKEEIVFELMACLQEEYDQKLYARLEEVTSTKQKLLALFDIYVGEDEIVQTQRKIYKEYLSVYIGYKTEKMQAYHTKMMQKYISVLEDIFKNSIKNGEFRTLSLEMIPSIFATLNGFFITEVKKETIYDYVDTLFALLKTTEKN